MNEVEARPALILVVNDEPVGRALTCSVLRQAQFDVIEAAAGEEGLALAERAAPDLVLLDVHLPDLSGLEVCRRIKASPEFERILVVFLSASMTSSESQAEALDSGGDGYIALPAAPREIVAKIRALLRMQRAEDRLRADLARRETLESIVNMSPAVAILWRQVPGWPVDFVSEGIRQFGYEPQDLLSGQISYESIMHPDDRQGAHEEARAHREAGCQSWRQVYRILTSDGSVRWVADHTSISTQRDGQIRRHQGILLDITERIKAEEALRIMERKAVKSRSAETIWRLVQGLAHEVRNPLFAIDANVAGLSRLVANQADAATFMAHIRSHVRRLGGLMKDLLEMGRPIDRAAFSELDLGNILGQAAAAAEQEVPGAEGRILQSLPASAVLVRGDASKLVLVFCHLLVNALESSARTERVSLSLTLGDDEAVVRVVDRGGGLPEKLKGVLFEPFVTGKVGRSGLGLALVRTFLEGHGGTVEAADNDPGPGACFTVRLPARE